MKYPKSKDVESKIKVILLTDKLDSAKLRNDIYEWAAEQGVNIFWLTTFLHSSQNEEGAWVYFEDVIDAMAFKLEWC